MNDVDSPRNRRSLAIGAVALAALTALLAAACGASRAQIRTTSVSSLSEAITCVVELAEEMDFEVVSLARDDHRAVLERTDEGVSRSDPSFQRAVDQLTALPAERSPGAAPALAVEARTFHEFFDRRGRTRRQRDASAGAVAAADTLLSRCGEDGGP